MAPGAPDPKAPPGAPGTPDAAPHRDAGSAPQRSSAPPAAAASARLPARADPLSWPPVWLALCALAAWGAGRAWPVPGAPAAGWALVGTGLAVMAAAAWAMRRGGATLDPTRAPTALVTRGIYRWSRNPIYLGDALILAGLCLRWQPLAALVLVPLFVAAITRRFIRREEAWLAARDPAGFAAYAARTRRWL